MKQINEEEFIEQQKVPKTLDPILIEKRQKITKVQNKKRKDIKWSFEDVYEGIKLLLASITLATATLSIANHIADPIILNEALKDEIDKMTDLLNTYSYRNVKTTPDQIINQQEYQQSEIAEQIDESFTLDENYGKLRMALLNAQIDYPEYNMPIILKYMDKENSKEAKTMEEYVKKNGFSSVKEFDDTIRNYYYNVSKEKESLKR